MRVNPLLQPFLWLGATLQKEQQRWVLWVPLGIACGIGLYFALPFEPGMAALGLTPLAALATYLLRYKTGLFIPALTLLTVALGFNASQIDTRLNYTPMLNRESGVQSVTGNLIYTEVMPEGVRLTLKDVVIGRIAPENTPTKIRIKMGNKGLADVPPPGSRISLWAQTGPFSEPVSPDANDFRRQSYFRQLGGLGWSYSKITLVDASPPLSWRDQFNLTFEKARSTLAHHVYARLSGDVAAMTVARLNGEQTGISKPVIEAMRIAGLAHLLSTSGFHVTIMGILIYYPLRAMLALIPWVALRFPIKKWAAGGAILSTTLYTLLVGSQAATLRSLLMSCIAMLAIIGDRRSNAMRLVTLSATLAMLLAPDAALGPSFQMSFAAVFCLIASHERTLGWLASSDHALQLPGPIRGFFHHMKSIITTSLIATAATTPFAIYHFQTFSFYGFIANMAAIPMTSFWVMPAILMAYLTAPFNMDGWFIDVAGSGIALTIKIATTVAAWPYSILYLPAMPWVALMLIILGGLWLCNWQHKWRWAGLLPVIVGAAYPLYTHQPDVMVAAGPKVWAVRLDDGRLAASNLDKDNFVYEQWQLRAGNPSLLDVTALGDDTPQMRCDAIGCVYTKAGHRVALPTIPAALLEDCRNSDIVIATVKATDCHAPYVLDDPTFWRHGSASLYLTGKTVRIERNRTRRAVRPWSPGWRQDKDE